MKRLSVMEKIQRSVADYLSRREALRGVSVTTDVGSSYGILSSVVSTSAGTATTSTLSTTNKLDKNALAALGLSIFVKLPTPSGASFGSGVVGFGNVICTVRVSENTITNQSGLSAPAAAEIVLKSLTGFTPDGANSSFIPDANYAWHNLSGTENTRGVDITVITSASI
jgi:hypothetical protein